MSFSPISKVEIPPVELVVVGNESDAVAKIGDSRIEQFLDLKDIAPKLDRPMNSSSVGFHNGLVRIGLMFI